MTLTRRDFLKVLGVGVSAVILGKVSFPENNANAATSAKHSGNTEQWLLQTGQVNIQDNIWAAVEECRCSTNVNN